MLMKIAPEIVVGPYTPGWDDSTLGENAVAVKQTPEPGDDNDDTDDNYSCRFTEPVIIVIIIVWRQELRVGG